MIYRASADWDLHFTDSDAVAEAADLLTAIVPAALVEPRTGPQDRLRAALADVSTKHDLGFDGGPALHLTGWTSGAVNVARCEAVMAALPGKATGTIDWSDEDGAHWRDRLTADGRWEKHPGIVVYPDSGASYAHVIIELAGTPNDPTLPVLDLNPLTRYTPDHPRAHELVDVLGTMAESRGATDVTLRCDAWLDSSVSLPEPDSAPPTREAHPARAAAEQPAAPAALHGRSRVSLT